MTDNQMLIEQHDSNVFIVLLGLIALGIVISVLVKWLTIEDKP
jgi:hypothetical protein